MEVGLLEGRAEEVTRLAAALQEDSQKLVRENTELLERAVRDRGELGVLLGRAQAQQAEVEARLGDMQTQLEQGRAATQLGDQILARARDTLDTLRDFENRVENNRAGARAALARTEEIEALIREARERTGQAGELLQDTDKDSSLAFSLAEDSALLARKASEKAGQIVLESSQTREETNVLVGAAGAGADLLVHLRTAYASKEEVAAADAALAATALREAARAGGIASEAARQVERARAELAGILHQLDGVEEPEPGLLEDLERRLDRAEAAYQQVNCPKSSHHHCTGLQAGVEARLVHLQEERLRQADWLAQYRAELHSLTQEFSSLQEIAASLPDRCWNKIRLEP